MERVKIDLYISDLLYQYDCVIVPDFGGFLTNFASAQMLEAQGKFLPPSKKVSFNRNLQVNDGLLANHIAGRKSISYQEALSLIKEFTSSSEEGLQKGNKVVIEKVGTLYTDVENNICFSPDPAVNYLQDSFGLESFKKLPFSVKSIEREMADGIKTLSTDDEGRTYKSMPWRAVAAIFLGIMGTTWLALNYQSSNNSGLNYSNFNFFESTPAKYSPKAPSAAIPELKVDGNYFIEKNDTFSELVLVEQLAQENAIIVKNFDESRASNTDIAEEHIEETAKAVSEEIPETTPVDKTFVADKSSSKRLKYHVIGGCFSVLENAENLFQQLTTKGFNAKMVGEHNDLHAVSYSSFATKQEALEMLSEIKSGENPHAWLLVK